MRTLTVLFLTLLSTMNYAQSLDFYELLQQGKDEFYKDFDNQNYENAVVSLEQAVSLNPDNAEAHYFLGYAYSRVNSKDGKGMIDMNSLLTLKSSEQFEIVNKMTPKYDGEIVVLDPYSKLTSEWGAQAMSYWHNNKPDSALWAFREGKSRGGFGEFFLSLNRKALDFCAQNAILISSGDNFTIPLWYLQIAENYRTDVTVIDISLLNTDWYPKFLVNNTNISFGVESQELDSVQLIQWADSVITIDIDATSSFSWTVKPAYYEQFLLRSDRLFLNLLIENGFKRDVYFTTAFVEDYQLSLKSHLNSLILIDRINYDNESPILFKEYKAKINSIIACLKYLNTNSQHELYFVDNIRYGIFSRIDDCLNAGNIKEAKKLIKISDKKVNPNAYPYQSDQILEFYEYLIQRMGK